MEWSGIAIFYFICLTFGFLFALIGAVFGEFLGHGDVGAGGHDVDLGHDIDTSAGLDADGHALDALAGHAGEMPGTSVLNSLTISTFAAFFGLIGLIMVWALKMDALPSLAISLPAAVVVAAFQFVLYVRIFIEAQGTSEATMSEILGSEADVITTVPGDRVGEIAYVIKGTRYTAPAISADGESIPRGTRVHVVNVKGNMFVVRPV